MRKLRVLVSGMMAADPGQGGATRAVLQYVLGLRRLGHEVTFVEPVAPCAVRPDGSALAHSLNAAYFMRVVAEFGLTGAAALQLTGTRETVGLPYDRLLAAAARCDLLLNISGLLTDPELLGRIPLRAYLDLDPVFNQIWHTQGVDVRFRGHNRFVTVALAIGRNGCAVPTCGLSWVTTVQPVVLEHWPPAGTVSSGALTTVANWRSYGPVEHEGVFYGQKAHSLRRFFALPTRSRRDFTLALAIHPDETADLDALARNGWRLVDPARVAGDPAAYRDFIRGSRAEFGIAKHGYVAARSGWFSDRSVCYLASGRPVFAQETGFSEYLPTGAGLFAFNDVDDVLAALDEVDGDYARHARSARVMAEEFFDSDKVLTRLLERIGADS